MKNNAGTALEQTLLLRPANLALLVAQATVGELPDEDPPLRAREVARVVLALLQAVHIHQHADITVRDGFYGFDCEHSWLELAELGQPPAAVLDVLSVGRVPPVMLVNVAGTAAHRNLYRPRDGQSEVDARLVQRLVQEMGQRALDVVSTRIESMVPNAPSFATRH